MLTMGVQINSVGVRKDLARILERLGPKYVARFLRRAGGIAKKSVRTSFQAGGRPPLAPLKPSTLLRRQYGQRRIVKGVKASVKTGRAKGNVPLGGAAGPFAKSISVRPVGDELVWVGPPRGLWGLYEIHAQGSARLPAREVVYLQGEDVLVIDNAAEKFVDDALGMGEGSLV